MSGRPPVPDLRLPRTDRPYGWGVVGSVLVHVVLIALIIGRQVADDAANRSRAPGLPGRRGGGGGAERIVRLDLPIFQQPPKTVPQPVRTVDVPVPPLQPIPLKIEKLDLPRQTGTVLSRVDVVAGAGPGQGGGVGAGLGRGAGADSGQGTGGEGGDLFPPRARYSILPPLPQPSSVRGRSFRVHFWVSAQGKVTRVRVDPDIKDAAYRQQFLAMMYEYEFEPARRLDGTRVDGEAVITITL